MRAKNTNPEEFSGLIEQIKLLRKIEPQKDWVVFCRSNLAMRIQIERKNDLLNRDYSILHRASSFFKTSSRSLVLVRITQALSFTLILLTVTASFTAWAATKSMPGSPLYRMKIAIEEIHLMAVSQEGRNKLQTEMADRRLEELRTVLNSSGSVQAKKDGVAEVAGQLQQQLLSEKDKLPLTKNNNNEAKSISAAKNIVDRANQVKKAIVEAKESLPADMMANVGEKLTEVADVADKTSLQALEIMVNKNDDTDSYKEQILAKFDEIIKDNETAIATIDTKNHNTSATSTADKFPINAVLVNQSDQAKDLVAKTKTSLADGNFSEALGTLKALNEIVNGAERIADSYDFQVKLSPEQPINKDENTSTSTQPKAESQE